MFRWIDRFLIVCLLTCSYGMAQEPDAPVSGFSFSIGLVGDLPYTTPVLHWQRLMWDIRAAELAFVVHVGDIKSSGQTCDDAYFTYIRDEFQCSLHPWFFTPGDNEWTDCNREKSGGYDPFERLAKLRTLFAQGNTSFGKQTLPLTRQSEAFPENTRWEYANMVFATLHVVGSGNGLLRQKQDSDTLWAMRQQEFALRDAANIEWLHAAFARARALDSRGIMLFMQADPETWDPQHAAPGFKAFLQALREQTIAFARPVAMIHGDSHSFRIDKPMRDAQGQLVEHFTRVEVFGAQDVHWAQAQVDSNDPQLFRFNAKIVNANRASHQPAPPSAPH